MYQILKVQNKMRMKWLYTFIAICSLVPLLAVLYFENFLWFGQGCESTSIEFVCNKRPKGSSWSYFYLTLEKCKKDLKGKFPKYLCSAGFNPEMPDSTSYSSKRKVYYSDFDRLEKREVPFSFFLWPLALLLTFLPVTFYLIIYVLIKVVVSLKKRSVKDKT